MVSLWPWRGDNSSPASFERALATLAAKISTNSTQLNSLHQRSRRLKALWTLYAGFTYILCALIVGLMVGWRNWGAVEVSALTGGPVLIYLVRRSLNAYYDYRVSNVTGRLEDLQRERDKTIERLKASTKYNSTQNLLEKYGGVSPSPQSPPLSSSPTTPGGVKRRNRPDTRQEGSTPNITGERRVGIIPPPTANIPRNRPLPNSPSTPTQNEPNLVAAAAARVLPFHGQTPSSPPDPNSIIRLPNIEPGPAEFAPNAFTEPPQYAAQAGGGEGHWYDRLLDLLLGDDETLPKNRLALICSHCKLVNGQAPPGVKNLEDVGRWRCGACAAWNGQEESAKKMVLDIKEQQRRQQKMKMKEKEPRTVSANVSDDVKLDRDLANRGSSSSPEFLSEGDEIMDEDDNLYVPGSTDEERGGADADDIAVTEEDDEEGEGEVTDSKSIPNPPPLKPHRRGGRSQKAGAVRGKKP